MGLGRGIWWLLHAPIARVVTLVCDAEFGGLVAGRRCGLRSCRRSWRWPGVATWFWLRPADFVAWWRAQYRYHFKIRPKWNEAMRAARLISTDTKHADRLSKGGGGVGQ